MFLAEFDVTDCLIPSALNRLGSETRSRLKGLLTLRLSGLDVSDSTLKLMIKHMPLLRRLDLSHCPVLTDQSISLLTATGSNTRTTLREFNLAGTHLYFLHVTLEEITIVVLTFLVMNFEGSFEHYSVNFK